jgi:hypothetical protein
MSGKERFQSDLTTLMKRLIFNDTPPIVETRLNNLKNWLIELQKQNIVKINHSVMELVCAKYLLEREYDIQIEHPLNSLLTCDLYGNKGLGNIIVEIETGFIPPENALSPLTYTSARLASKIIRYSSFAGKFALGVPPHYILPFPPLLAKPPRLRTEIEIEQIKALCDAFYQNPPVTREEIANARIHEIYIIDVDHGEVKEIDPEAYQKRSVQKGIVFDCLTPEF